MPKSRPPTSSSPTTEECLAMGRSCACFNLRRAARAVTQIFDSYLDEVDLKATQIMILAVLQYGEGTQKSYTVTELAERLVLEQSSLSRNLAVLERRKWVKLVPGADRRERIVTLTRAGRTALARGYEVWKKAQEAVAGDPWARELSTELRALRKMTDRARGLNDPRGAASGW